MNDVNTHTHTREIDSDSYGSHRKTPLASPIPSESTVHSLPYVASAAAVERAPRYKAHADIFLVDRVGHPQAVQPGALADDLHIDITQRSAQG